MTQMREWLDKEDFDEDVLDHIAQKRQEKLQRMQQQQQEPRNTPMEEPGRGLGTTTAEQVEKDTLRASQDFTNMHPAKKQAMESGSLDDSNMVDQVPQIAHVTQSKSSEFPSLGRTGEAQQVEENKAAGKGTGNKRDRSRSPVS